MNEDGAKSLCTPLISIGVSFNGSSLLLFHGTLVEIEAGGSRRGIVKIRSSGKVFRFLLVVETIIGHHQK